MNYSQLMIIMLRNAAIHRCVLNRVRRCTFTSDAGSQNNDDVNEMKKNLDSYLESSPLKGTQQTTRVTPEIIEKAKIDPETTSIIMFPGQGNQYVGMGKNLMHHSIAQDMFETASTILGYDLKKLCLNGPASKLNRTEYCQPATLVCSLAAVEDLKQNYPTAMSSCVATCGFSVGEIAALVFAGCINFDKAVHLTRVRAEAMQACSDSVQSGLLTVLYGPDSNLKDAIKDAIQECHSAGIENPVCQVANYLIPECKVVGGHDVALNYIEKNKAKYKIRKTSRLNVSGAFHTELMKAAAAPVAKVLQNIYINKPVVPIMSNYNAKPYSTVSSISKILPKQIYSPVKWEQIVTYLYNRPSNVSHPHTYECGPGKSLSVLMSRLNAKAARNFHSVPA